MPRWLWLLVTQDKFELPLYVTDTAQQLADYCKVSNGTVCASAKRKGDGVLKYSKYERVKLDEDLAEELEAELAQMDYEWIERRLNSED